MYTTSEQYLSILKGVGFCGVTPWVFALHLDKIAWDTNTQAASASSQLPDKGRTSFIHWCFPIYDTINLLVINAILVNYMARMYSLSLKNCSCAN